MSKFALAGRLPPISPKSKEGNTDSLQIAQIRMEMMKVQQSIQRLTSDLERIKEEVPEDMSSLLTQLECNSLSIDNKVKVELEKDWISQFEAVKSNLEMIDYNYIRHKETLQKAESSVFFANECNNLEKKLKKENTEFLDNLRAEVDKKIDEILESRKRREESKKEFPNNGFKFSAVLAEPKNTEVLSESKRIQQVRHDPTLSLRVRRHKERLSHLEDSVSALLSLPKPKPIKEKNKEINEMIAKAEDNIKEIEQKLKFIKHEEDEKFARENTTVKHDVLGERITKEQLRDCSIEIEREILELKDDIVNDTNYISKEIDAILSKIQNDSAMIKDSEVETNKVKGQTLGVEENTLQMSLDLKRYENIKTEKDAEEQYMKSKLALQHIRDRTGKEIELFKHRLSALMQPSYSKRIE